MFDTLTPIEQELLRLLFFAPDHTATGGHISDLTFYTEKEVFQTLYELQRTGFVVALEDDGQTVRYRPNPAMIAQMKIKNQQADSTLADALAQARKDLRARN